MRGETRETGQLRALPIRVPPRPVVRIGNIRLNIT